MKIEDLIAEVAERTRGTPGDPLTLEEVGQVVRATVKVLVDRGELVAGGDDDEA